MSQTTPVLHRLLPAPAGPVDPLDAYAGLRGPGGRPALRVNMIASLDGAAVVDGVSGGLGGPADRAVYLALRTLADVVLVAAGTVRAEGYGAPRLPDALVAARTARGAAPLPRIAVVSGSLNLDLDAPLFTGRDGPRPMVVTAASAPGDARARVAEVADVVVAGEQRVDPALALAALGRAGARSVLAEGGPSLNGQLAAAGVVDELCLTLSPRLVGGEARRILTGPPVAGAPRMRLLGVCEADGYLFLRTGAAAP